MCKEENITIKGAGKLQKKTHACFIKEVEELVGGEYKVLTKYKNRVTHVKMKHNHPECGHRYDVRPCDFFRGRRCPKCSYNRKSQKQFVEEINLLTSGEYLVLSRYQNSVTHVQMKHNDSSCGHEYSVRPCDFLRGRRCPKCRSSKGEKNIQALLDSWGYDFEEQVRFSSCRNVNPLPFDFGIKDQDGNIVFLIEYDGEQHFKEMNFFGGRNAYVKRVRNDRIKSNFAHLNEIPLFRVFYNQPNKEELLKNVLENFFASKEKNTKKRKTNIA